MSKSSRAKRAEAWQRRQPLNKQVVIGHKNEVDPRTGKQVAVPVYAVEPGWDDPKVVRDEVRRIDEEMNETDLRIHNFSKEIAELEALLKDGPARLAKLSSLVTKETARLERLKSKRADTQLRLGGAVLAQDIDRLTARLLATARALEDAKEGKTPTVVTHKAETHRVDCSIGDTVALPFTGEKTSNGVAGVDPRIAAEELRKKIASRS